MSENQRENQSDPEFVTRIAEGSVPSDFFFDVFNNRDGVFYFGGPFPTAAAAHEQAALLVRAILKARIAAAGVGRCAERPAFPKPEAFGDAAQYLEGEESCASCGHLEGVHRIDGNCTVPGFESVSECGMPCRCEWFTAAPAGEVVL